MGELGNVEDRDASESLLAVTDREDDDDRRSDAECNRGEERRIEEVL